MVAGTQLPAAHRSMWLLLLGVWLGGVARSMPLRLGSLARPPAFGARALPRSARRPVACTLALPRITQPAAADPQPHAAATTDTQHTELVVELEVSGAERDKRAIVARRADGSVVRLLDGLGAKLRVDAGARGALVVGFAAESAARSFRALDLGTLRADRWLAASRVKRWWMGPLQGRRGGSVPVETQFLLVRAADPDGPPVFFALVPLLSGGFRSTLCGNRLTGQLAMHTDSGDEAVRCASLADCVLIGAAADPYEAVRRAMRAASERMGGRFRVREEKVAPGYLDNFGWCTWDAFYTAVDPSLVLAGVRALG
jgi:raffinose synthase